MSNALNDIWNFLTTHKAAFGLAGAWAIREWSTVGGWRGIKNYFLTGQTNPPQPEAKTNTETK